MEEYCASLTASTPPPGLGLLLTALWWDAKGEWERAHQLVDALSSVKGMAVHAYLHRKEGVDWNAEYWYARAGTGFRRTELGEEWMALAEAFLQGAELD